MLAAASSSRPTVIGLSGCSAVGKSTVVQTLQQQRVATTCICCDDFYKPKLQCPSFDLATLQWPSGSIPTAFAERGNHDLNVPAAVDWAGVRDAVAEQSQGSGSGTVIVDGLLLFADHPGAREVLGLCDHTAVIWADGEDEATMKMLQTRKWARSDHLGKKSYSERGVTAEEYEVYFASCVWPKWLEHGASRVPESSLRIDCTQPVEQQVAELLSTGWFPPPSAAPLST